MKRIGMYGGTFDPLHVGHLVVAERARCALGLDEVVFVPCGLPALKRAARAEGDHRLAMVAAAIADRPEFSVSDLELRREGVSYTVETLETLTEAQPGHWWLLLGGDALADFERWYRPERILELARLAVADRPGAELEALWPTLSPRLRERLDRVSIPQLEIASRHLREDLQAGRSVRYLVPDPVHAYLTKHRLYRDA